MPDFREFISNSVAMVVNDYEGTGRWALATKWLEWDTQECSWDSKGQIWTHILPSGVERASDGTSQSDGIAIL